MQHCCHFFRVPVELTALFRLAFDVCIYVICVCTCNIFWECCRHICCNIWLPFFQYQRCVLLLPTLNEIEVARPTHIVDLSAKLGGIIYCSHELLRNFLAMRHKKLLPWHQNFTSCSIDQYNSTWQFKSSTVLLVIERYFFFSETWCFINIYSTMPRCLEFFFWRGWIVENSIFYENTFHKICKLRLKLGSMETVCYVTSISRQTHRDIFSTFCLSFSFSHFNVLVC